MAVTVITSSATAVRVSMLSPTRVRVAVALASTTVDAVVVSVPAVRVRVRVAVCAAWSRVAVTVCAHVAAKGATRKGRCNARELWRLLDVQPGDCEAAEALYEKARLAISGEESAPFSAETTVPERTEGMRRK